LKCDRINRILKVFLGALGQNSKCLVSNKKTLPDAVGYDLSANVE
jgi:hypothetical protein